ncbi:MAG: hypothetical protein A3J74_03225, partial [Elusimicrobia bacterium RIFCSPHIGHO2_02_FULL_57_9]
MKTDLATQGAFTPEERKILAAWVAYYSYPHMGLIEAMRQIQQWHRCIRPQDEEYLARLFKTTRTHVHELATFFPYFTQSPMGRYRIGICRGLSCALAGSSAMVSCLEKQLGVKAGQATPDGALSFEEMECLGACDFAPALLVNEQLRGRASEQVLSALTADPQGFAQHPGR